MRFLRNSLYARINVTLSSSSQNDFSSWSAHINIWASTAIGSSQTSQLSFWMIISVHNERNEHAFDARVCLKIHSRHLHVPLHGIFGPNSGYIAHYASFIWLKYPTNCDAHLPESNFQTRSSPLGACIFDRISMKVSNFAKRSIKYNYGYRGGD